MPLFRDPYCVLFDIHSMPVIVRIRTVLFRFPSEKGEEKKGKRSKTNNSGLYKKNLAETNER